VVPTVLLVHPSVRIQQQPALRVLLQVVPRRVVHVLLILTVLRVHQVACIQQQHAHRVLLQVVPHHVILVKMLIIGQLLEVKTTLPINPKLVVLRGPLF
jgi:hypothetical protein